MDDFNDFRRRRLGSIGTMLQRLVFGLNLGFMVFGLVFVILGVYLIAKLTSALHMFSIVIPVLMILIGVVTTMLAFCGCFGAWKRNTQILVVFFAALSIIVALEIGIASAAYHNKDGVNNEIEQTWFSFDDSEKNWVQQEFKCCGFYNVTLDRGSVCYVTEDLPRPGAGPVDAGSADKSADNSADNVTTPGGRTGGAGGEGVPDGGQSGGSTPAGEGTPNSPPASATDSTERTARELRPVYFTEDCRTKLVTFWNSHMFLIVGFVVTTIIIESVTLVLAVLLFCAMQQRWCYSDEYDELEDSRAEFADFSSFSNGDGPKFDYDL